MISYQKSIEVKYETDIVVIGGGPAGISAAVTAARSGKKVILVEETGVLGGMGTLGRVPGFCAFSDGINFLAGGIGKEIHTLCLENDAVSPDCHKYHTQRREVINIKSEKLKVIYDNLLLEAGVKLLLFTRLVDAKTTDGKIDYIVLSGKSSLFALKASVYIDASGDGVLSYYSGAEYLMGNEDGEMQPGTVCSLWSYIDWDKVEAEGFNRPATRKFVEQAYKDGIFKTLDRKLCGIWRVGENTGGGNLGHEYGVDGTDEESLTQAIIEGRKRLPEYEAYYKTYLKGFEDMELSDSAPVVGIRETRRIMGDYVLNIDDFIARAVFDDEIGRYNYSIDEHPTRNDEKHHKEHESTFSMKYQIGESYGIPYRCLTPKGITNLLVAGRCISTDRSMQASTRVMPCCFITGQAAGMAAAIAESENTDVHKIDVKALQGKLKDMGAYLPNFEG